MKDGRFRIVLAALLWTVTAAPGWAAVLPWEEPEGGKASDVTSPEKRAARPAMQAVASNPPGAQPAAAQWPAERREQEPPVEQPPAGEEQLRPEMLDLLNSDVPRDGKVEVTVGVAQDIGNQIYAEVRWDGETAVARLNDREPQPFRLSPERHVLYVRAYAPPLWNDASVAIDLTEGRPHRVEIEIKPRFNGADITLKVFRVKPGRGEYKIFEKRFGAPDP